MKWKFIAMPLTVFDVKYGCEYNGKLNRKYENKDLTSLILQINNKFTFYQRFQFSLKASAHQFFKCLY